MLKLVLASANKGKIIELRELLSDLDLDLISLDKYPNAPKVNENGHTFAENAALKARIIAEFTGELTLADDSGLEVDALKGEPGIYSARYGKPGWDDRERYRFLLEKLQGVPLERRTARFRCSVALCNPDPQKIDLVDGTVEGLIIDEPKGTNGFGYDPVFFIPELGKTMAELPADQKNRFSHRARALEGMKTYLYNYLMK